MSDLKTKLTQKVLLTLDSWQKGVADSSFAKTGKITSKEFVVAGDFLVANFPSWSWASGQPQNRRSHLPQDKQFLISKNVPCFPREEREIKLDELKLDDGDDGWIQTSLVGGETEGKGHIGSLDDDAAAQTGQEELADDEAEEDFEDLPTLDDEEGLEGTFYKNAVEDEDEAALGAEGDSAGNIKRLRSYDISIHYDGHYSTPRVWLFGYDPDGKPLQGDAWKEDFSPEHVDKTVTFERHPHLGYHCPSIHPCKHAEGMKNTVELLVGDEGAVDPKFYMVIFLKFIQSVIPNIEYDYTSKFEVSPRQAD